jgi:hypothetical protein
VLLAFCAFVFADEGVAQDATPSAQPTQTPPVTTPDPVTNLPQAQPADAPATGSRDAAAEAPDGTTGPGAGAAPRQENGVANRAATYWRFAALVVGLVAVLAFLASVLFLVARFAESLATERIGIESSWGGFGGASSGWNLSRPLSLLVTIALLGSFAYMSLDAVLRAVDGRADVNPPAETADEADEPDQGADSQAQAD